MKIKPKEKSLDDLDESLFDQLKDPEFAAAYLDEHLSYQGPKRAKLILDAIHKVVKTRKKKAA